ncbi:GRIP and coiled-coil domain-containing protein 2 isoform X2 [Hyperolius riggenbachi]|uniref:GRIP and coiled-coil domain-containing protein 2 isoform X2 n=1 Tax=Hyperolius riggenbachi TaxID=752182 RepID=UPI0035A3CE9D
MSLLHSTKATRRSALHVMSLLSPLHQSHQQDTGQDGVQSPATPGGSKSKLDTLPKEDLIKFAKKQMMMIQKVKSRCTELEKEIETLKTRTVNEEDNDIVQALTERLDIVLLEKAETQQQLVSLKKEFAKTKEDADAAVKKASELEQNKENANNVLLKEIEALKNELLQTQDHHKEDVEAVKKELQDALLNQKELTDRLKLEEDKDVQVRKLKEDIQNIHSDYEEKLNSLKGSLETAAEENSQLTTKLKDAQVTSEQYHAEIQDLHAKFLKLQNQHNDEVANIMQEFESSTEQNKQERILLEDSIKECSEKEKLLQEEIRENNLKNGQEIEQLKQTLEENRSVQQNLPLFDNDKIQQLESYVRNLESQQSLLRDELTYTSNLKIRLEKEVEHVKKEYFHEREELEFKINELQVAIEDYNGLTEKLQTELKSSKREYTQLSQQRTEDIQTMREQHKREIAQLKQSITSRSEDERKSFVHELQVLKAQVDKISQEKEEAVNSYENLRETFLTLQAELGDSAGKISREFETMKQQQASDVHELQQKLRTAYKEKNDLLETVNRLQNEVESLSAKRAECKELQLSVANLQQTNEEFLASIQQKEDLLKDLQSRVNEATLESSQISSELKMSNEELQKLQELYKIEQAKVVTLQQEAEDYVVGNEQLKQTVNELKQKLVESVLPPNQSADEDLQLSIANLQQSNEEFLASLQQKEDLLKDLQLRVNEAALENSQVSSHLKMSNEELEKLQELYKIEQAKVVTLQQEAEDYIAVNKQLSETVNELKQKLEECVLPPNQSANEDLQLQLTKLQQINNDVFASLQEKETLLKELQLKIEVMATQNTEARVAIESSKEKILQLQELRQSETEEYTTINEQLKHSVEELTKQLHASLNGRDESIGEIRNLQQQVDLLITNKEKLESESKRWQEEALRLQEEKEVISRDFARLVCEHSDCGSNRDEVDNLRSKFQMASEGKDKVALLLEQKERFVEEIKSQFNVVQDLLAIECPDQDVRIVLQDITKAILQLKDEKQNAILQKEETAVQLDRLQEEFDAQCSELRALLSDYSKEKVLLKEELEETLTDNEALQRDLLEMKNALEKSKQENQELLLRIETVTSDLNSLHNESGAESREHTQEDLISLAEKEFALSALKPEVNSVQGMLSESKELELKHEALVSDLQNKIASLETECKEREEKCNKIKAVAVKAKRELDANKKEVQSIKKEFERVRAEKDQLQSSMKDLVQGAENYQNLLVEYDKQAELLEKAKEQANATEHKLEELSRQLRAAVMEQEKMNSVNEDLVTRVETFQTNSKLLEAQILDLQKTKAALEKDLEAEKLIKEHKIKDQNHTLKQMEDLQAQLQKERNQDAQKSTLMDMEIADYERLVKELNQKLTHKSSQLEDLEQEIFIQKQKQETLQQEILSLQSTIEQHEERSTKMKQLLVKTKKELADSKQTESDQLILQASLKGELEASQQHVEAFKIQIAELTSEKHKVQEQLRSLTEQHQRAGISYQQKLLALQEERTAAKAEQAAVTAEFESYKVRVHNVLKQQKNKTASQAEHEAFKQERDHLQTMLDQVKSKLQEAQHSLQMSTAELQALQSDHDMLLERHNKMLQETVTKEAELREKLCSVQSENMVLKTEHAQVVSQLSAQNEAQRNSFRDQVRHLQDDHRKTVETLQKQLSKVESQLFQVKSEITTSNSQQPVKSLRDRRPTDLPVLDLYSAAREEGEGMETTDTDSVSSASTHIASLDQLLNSSDTKTVMEPLQWQPELSKEELTEKLNTASKSVDHLSGLLHETEATNAMLMEQITLLKNEIRRLERNQEREKSVANLEYLKNVLLQFIFLKAGSERQRLLPVIDTMLQLSPEEKGKLHAIAQGEEDPVARPAGWASYLHSWSGLR